MEYNELPEDLQEEVHALKHGCVTIESNVECALEQAGCLEEFKNAVDGFMDDIISEAQGVRASLGTEKESTTTVRKDATSAFEEGQTIAYPLCTIDKEDIRESAANLGLKIEVCDFEEIIKRLCLRIADTFGDVWGDTIDEEVEFVVNNRISKEIMK